jgi:GT2 family glycosyltransferase
MRVSVIIVSWNALHHLRAFLPTVVSSVTRDVEIILADNASTDGSADWVRATYPNVTVATFDRNYGYCGGNNRGADAAKGDILIFLNNDVRVEAGWIAPILDRFRSDAGIAVVQPKLRSHERPTQFEYAGAAGGFLDAHGFPFCRGRLFDTVETDHGQYDHAGPIFWASGAAICVRADVFREAGGFDEDFEFHMEEIDLCWRIQLLGHAVWYEPKSVVYHLGGGSLPPSNPRKLFYNYRNNIAMLIKNLPASRVIPVMVARNALDSIAMIRMLARGDGAGFAAMWKASVVSTFSIRKNWKKRLDPSRIRRHVPLAPFSVVWQYFAKTRKTFTELPKLLG